MITIVNVLQGSERWHKEREGFFTGSNAHKLLGSFGASEYAKAEDSNFGGNFHTKRGHLLEDKAIDLYQRRHNTKVGRSGVIKNSLYPRSLYSPDGIDTCNEEVTLYDIDEDGEVTVYRLPRSHILIEVKCFTGKHYNDVYDNGPDFKILAQVHYGLLITGLSHARLVIYNPRYAKKRLMDAFGNEYDNPDYNPKRAYKEFPIRRDKTIQSNYQRILGEGAKV